MPDWEKAADRTKPEFEIGTRVEITDKYPHDGETGTIIGQGFSSAFWTYEIRIDDDPDETTLTHVFGDQFEVIDEVDLVNNPPHYTAHPSGIECIQITEHMGFNLGNAIKYVWRADLKGDSIQDLEKATWYINREIARRQAG